MGGMNTFQKVMFGYTDVNVEWANKNTTAISTYTTSYHIPVPHTLSLCAII